MSHHAYRVCQDTEEGGPGGPPLNSYQITPTSISSPCPEQLQVFQNVSLAPLGTEVLLTARRALTSIPVTFKPPQRQLQAELCLFSKVLQTEILAKIKQALHVDHSNLILFLLALVSMLQVQLQFRIT